MPKTVSILRPAPTLARPLNRLGRKPHSDSLYPHISRKLLAAAVGTASETVVRVLNGSVDPTLALAGAIARQLGITVECLTRDLTEVRRARGVKGGRQQKQVVRAKLKASGKSKSTIKTKRSRSKSK